MKRAAMVNLVPLRINGAFVIDPSAQGEKIGNRYYRLAVTATVLPAVGSFLREQGPMAREQWRRYKRRRKYETRLVEPLETLETLNKMAADACKLLKTSGQCWKSDFESRNVYENKGHSS